MAVKVSDSITNWRTNFWITACSRSAGTSDDVGRSLFAPGLWVPQTPSWEPRVATPALLPTHAARVVPFVIGGIQSRLAPAPTCLVVC